MMCSLPSEIFLTSRGLTHNNCNTMKEVVYATVSRMCTYFPRLLAIPEITFAGELPFPVALLKPKVNYLYNFHLKFYLSVNSHFPQWSTALNEFTKLTAYITTKKEQCSFAELQILGSICLPARGENSLLHTQLCSRQVLEGTSAMFKCL